jgi:phosphoglucosamine mutase
MMRLFGTDGVRGTANSYPMTPDIIVKLAQATAHYYVNNVPTALPTGEHRPTVVIGKDTRLSGYMVEASLMAGFVSMGMDVILLGPLPTPAVAMLTRSLRAQMGVMISASHNHFEDNGIKFFNHEGLKFSTDEEKAIEALVLGGSLALTPPSYVGKAKRLDDALGRYIEFTKATFPRGQRLDNLNIVVDCANGATYKAAPRIFWELGANVIPIAAEPNGSNINLGCGATHPALIAKKVVEHQADIGIALDGDGDRLLMVDEKGRILDGDQLLALIATSWLKNGQLQGGAVVGTVMSNLGLERYLHHMGLKLYRPPVGDRFVFEHMRTHGCNVGGEQSGHIILSDYATTGDGITAALQILSLLKQTGRKASDLGDNFTPVPQVLKNIQTATKVDLTCQTVKEAIARAQTLLTPLGGHILVRPSGTEPLIRVMAQGDDEHLLTRVVNDLALAIQP